MAVTFGFYNSQNGDRTYNADQMSSLFAGIIRDGVFEDYPAEGNHLKIRKGTGLNMIIGPGRAWFNNTWTDNDAELTIAIDSPPAISGMDRVDAIVLEINKSNTTDNNSDISPYVVEGRTNKFVVLKGTVAPSESATHPTPRNGNGIYQHPLAWVRVSGSSPGEIVSFNNLIGATDQCPFVMNAIENISAEDVIQSWTDALNAAILQFHNNAQLEIDAVVEDYFNDPGSEIYREIRTLRTEFENEIDGVETALTKTNSRRHIWIVDKPIHTVAGAVESYSKNLVNDTSSPAGHTIYPDFLSQGQVIPERSPKVGDVVIGSNGYYATVDTWTPGSESYTMLLRSTGKSLADTSTGAFKIVFSGGHDRFGDRSGIDVATCSATFADIKAAYERGNKIEAVIEFFYQVHQSGTGVDVYQLLNANVELETRNGTLTKVIATCIDYDSVPDYTQGSPNWHKYVITSSGVTDDFEVLS